MGCFQVDFQNRTNEATWVSEIGESAPLGRCCAKRPINDGKRPIWRQQDADKRFSRQCLMGCFEGHPRHGGNDGPSKDGFMWMEFYG